MTDENKNLNVDGKDKTTVEMPEIPADAKEDSTPTAEEVKAPFSKGLRKYICPQYLLMTSHPCLRRNQSAGYHLCSISFLPQSALWK